MAAAPPGHAAPSARRGVPAGWSTRAAVQPGHEPASSPRVSPTTSTARRSRPRTGRTPGAGRARSAGQAACACAGTGARSAPAERSASEVIPRTHPSLLLTRQEPARFADVSVNLAAARAGIARLWGVQLGWVTIGVSGLVLLAWIPLRQRPGLGTVSNAVIVGLVVNGALDVLPAPGSLAWRAVWLAAGIGLNGLATACYIGAGLGPGPRDGLMTGIAARGHSLRAIRTLIELSVLAIGFALGGTVGVGTLAYALTIGPLTHLLLPRLTVTTPPGTKGARDQ